MMTDPSPRLAIRSSQPEVSKTEHRKQKPSQRVKVQLQVPGSDMNDIEVALKADFPEATEAEVKRFLRSCQNGNNKGEDEVKLEAEKLLEDYLDWRSCFGLDYKKEESDVTSSDADADDWKFAIEKSLEAYASMRRAKELEAKLAQEEVRKAEAEKVPVNYDVEFSDSQKSECGDTKGNEAASATTGSTSNDACDLDNKDDTANEMSEDEKKKKLSQIIFQHIGKDGSPITDKGGSKILYVLPALINRKVAQADFYALALSFYLDRKFDRSSEEKMTVVIDVRAGDGWPNPMAVMMVKFAHTVMRQLQQRYPERLESLVVFPLPWAAMGVWSAIKRVFRLDILDKITLVSGPAETTSPLPKEKIEGLIDPDILDAMEQLRIDYFKPIGTCSIQD